MAISMVISGGQSGVDRAALDAAVDLGIACGGWCPQGRRAEDGAISERYALRETPSNGYTQRTEWNVRDSDGTLILYQQALSGGTLLTKTLAEKLHKPCLLVDPTTADAAGEIQDWLRRQAFSVLNIAGPRESQRPGIYRHAYDVLIRVLQHPA